MKTKLKLLKDTFFATAPSILPIFFFQPISVDEGFGRKMAD